MSKSRQDEFDFEYGEDFAQHIESIGPRSGKFWCDTIPNGDVALNDRQVKRLQRLSSYLQSQGRALFMFELLVPAELSQLAQVQGDKRRYDLELRPELMMRAITQLQDGGVEPDLWKIEGLDRRDDCEKIVAGARRKGREKVSCIVLGRGEYDHKIHEWLEVAAGVSGFIGFAVGRTDFWESLVAWRAGQQTRVAAVAEIARRYREFADVLTRGQTSQS